jgi:hypothetical protein
VRGYNLESLSHRIGQQLTAQSYDIIKAHTPMEKVQAIDGAGAQAGDAQLVGGLD